MRRFKEAGSAGGSCVRLGQMTMR